MRTKEEIFEQFKEEITVAYEAKGYGQVVHRKSLLPEDMAYKAMQEYADTFAVEFAKWKETNGWKYHSPINAYINTISHVLGVKTTSELFQLFKVEKEIK